MKIRNLIEELERTMKIHGNIECHIETIDFDSVYLMPIQSVDTDNHPENSQITIAILTAKKI